jgi:Domain of unknown function (DUF4129)
MTSRQPGTAPPGTPESTGSHWGRLVPLVLLIVLGLAGLRGAVGTPRWDGPLHQDGLAVGLGLEAVFAILILVTLRRRKRGSQEAVPVKLRAALLTALGTGAAAVALVTLIGLNLHLFTLRPRKVERGRRPPGSVPSVSFRPRAKGPGLHVPLADVLYALLILLLLAAVVASIWWARRRRPALGRPAGDFVAEDSEDLRAAVASGRSALRMVDDARAAIIACYLAMEQSLAERGTARGVADTPDELLARAQDRGLVRGPAAARLTALFYEARFSSHPLGPAQRDAAGRALDELAAALAAPEAAGASG